MGEPEVGRGHERKAARLSRFSLFSHFPLHPPPVRTFLLDSTRFMTWQLCRPLPRLTGLARYRMKFCAAIIYNRTLKPSNENVQIKFFILTLVTRKPRFTYKQINCIKKKVCPTPACDPKCDFGGSLTDDEVIDSSIDDVIVYETLFHPLMGELNERSVVTVKEVTRKKVAVDSSAIGYELWQRLDITWYNL